MSKVSFAATPEAAAAQKPIESAEDRATVAQFAKDTGTSVAGLATPTTVAVVPSAPVSTTPASRFSDDPEDIDFSQLTLPTLKIVQGVGELSAVFSPGQIIVVGKGDVLIPVADAPPKAGQKGATPQKPVNIVLIAISRNDRFSEKIPGGTRGRLFDTEKQVLDAGGTTNYEEGKATGKPYFERLATALLLVEKPEGLEDETGTFGLEADGKKYALVFWHLKGIGYTNAAKPLRTARRFGFLKPGYSSAVVELGTALKTYGQNSAFIPTVRPGGATSDGVRSVVNEVLGR